MSLHRFKPYKGKSKSGARSKAFLFFLVSNPIRESQNLAKRFDGIYPSVSNPIRESQNSWFAWDNIEL